MAITNKRISIILTDDEQTLLKKLEFEVQSLSLCFVFLDLDSFKKRDSWIRQTIGNLFAQWSSSPDINNKWSVALVVVEPFLVCQSTSDHWNIIDFLESPEKHVSTGRFRTKNFPNCSFIIIDCKKVKMNATKLVYTSTDDLGPIYLANYFATEHSVDLQNSLKVTPENASTATNIHPFEWHTYKFHDGQFQILQKGKTTNNLNKLYVEHTCEYETDGTYIFQNFCNIEKNLVKSLAVEQIKHNMLLTDVPSHLVYDKTNDTWKVGYEIPSSVQRSDIVLCKLLNNWSFQDDDSCFAHRYWVEKHIILSNLLYLNNKLCLSTSILSLQNVKEKLAIYKFWQIHKQKHPQCEIAKHTILKPDNLEFYEKVQEPWIVKNQWVEDVTNIIKKCIDDTVNKGIQRSVVLDEMKSYIESEILHNVYEPSPNFK